MSRISLKAVIIGGLIDISTSLFTGFFLAFTLIAWLGVSHLSRDQIQLTLKKDIRSTGYFLVATLIGLLCSTLAGYIAARIAKHDEVLNGALSSFLCLMLSVYMTATGKDTHPLIVQLGLLIAGPAFGALGGYLRQVQSKMGRGSV